MSQTYARSSARTIGNKDTLDLALDAVGEAQPLLGLVAARAARLGAALLVAGVRGRARGARAGKLHLDVGREPAVVVARDLGRPGEDDGAGGRVVEHLEDARVRVRRARREDALELEPQEGRVLQREACVSMRCGGASVSVRQFG